MSRSAIPRTVILEREKKVWAMRMRGHTYESIAEEIGITFKGVGNILARMHKRYLKNNMDDVQKCRQEQIAELSNVAKEAYAAWERSKGQKITIKKRARAKDGTMLPGEASEERYESDGDTRYLNVYLKAKEDLRKIMGADAPIKNELTGKNGQPLEIVNAFREPAKNQIQKFMDKVFAKKDDSIKSNSPDSEDDQV